MRHRGLIVVGSIALAAGVIVPAAMILVPSLLMTTLSFKIEDAVSHSWVWDATIVVQRREIRSFFQSDSAPRETTFTGLKPGPAILSVKAPYYREIGLPLRLKPGRNVLSKPVALVGLTIPGLDHFTMVETPAESSLRVEMRPVDARGNAVSNHPCIPLWAGARVSAEVVNGELARDAYAAHPVRGPTLFNGKIAWKWDPDPAAAYRYVATIPYSVLTDRTAPLLVIDYLVVVPDPTRMNAQELDTMMSAAPQDSDISILKAYLDTRRGDDRFEYFLTASWNVKGSSS
jgi:hypothetical protein